MRPHRRQPTRLPLPGILQARTLEWVAISSSNAWKWKVKVKSLSRVRLFATPWIAAYQAPPSMGFSRQEYWSGVPLPSPPLRTRLGQQKLVYWWHLYKFPFALCPLKRTGWAFLELVRVCAKPWAALWTSLAIVLFTVHWYSKALMLRVSGLKALVLRWILRTCKGIWVWWCRLRLRANETWVQTPSLPN